METYSIWIDEVPAFSEAWQVYDMPGRRGLPERIQGSTSAPGHEGAWPFFGAHAPRTFSLKFWIDSCKPDGSEPADRRLQHDLNTSEVLSLFSKPGTLRIKQKYADGSYRYASVRVVGEVVPELTESASEAPLSYLTVMLENPSCWWTDRTLPLVWSTAPVWVETKLPLIRPGAYAGPIADGVYEFRGPWVNPGVQSGESFVTWPGTLTANDTLRIDAERMTAVIVTTGVAGHRTVASSLIYDDVSGGFFSLYPPYRLACAGTGTTAASRFTFSGFPKFA